MSIATVISNLLTSFSRRDVKKATECLKQDIEDSTGVFESANVEFFKWDWKSKYAKEFEHIWKNNIKTVDHHKDNFIASIFTLIKRLNENIDLIESLTDRAFEEEIMRDGLTYMSANILMYLETSSFAVRYANRLLRYVIIEETRVLDGREVLTLSRSEIKWMNDNLYNFLRSFDSINVDRRHLKDIIEKIPDVVVESEQDGLFSNINRTLTDPFKMGFIGVKYNPIFYIRTAIAEWQNDRNEARKLERKTLEFRLMRLHQLASENNNDPGLKKQIDYYESKLQAAVNSITSYEEDFQ